MYTLVLQRNDGACWHEVIINLCKTEHGYSMLTDTVNSLELITFRQLSKGSGKLDDAVLAGGSDSRLVRGTEAAGLRQVEVRVSLL